MNLSGKVILVTGAASGIGKSVVDRAVADGAVLVAVDKDEAGLKRLAAGFDAAVLDTHLCDFVDGAAAHRVVAATVARRGRLDALIACAGTSIGKKLADTAEDEWDEVFAVNVKGTYLWFSAAIRHMVARGGGGSLVAFSSSLAVSGGRDNAAYVASKGALLSLVKSVALDYAAAGIRANAVLPAATDTPLFGRNCERSGDPAAARQRAAQRQPLGRIGRPEEIAAAALFLASEDASFITGIPVPVDGGRLIA